MSHNTLENYYKVIFSMAHHYNYSISDLESLVCYELDVYISLVKNHNEEVKQQRLEQQQAQQAMQKTRF